MVAIAGSAVRVSMPRAPWPPAGMTRAGSNSSLICPARPRRLRPAAASTAASTSPAITLSTRVGTLPRSGTKTRSPRSAASWQIRRRLEVPTRAPAGRSANEIPPRETSASRTSSRSDTAAIVRPGARSAGTSFML